MLTQDEYRIFFNLNYAKETQVEDRELYIKLFLIYTYFLIGFSPIYSVLERYVSIQNKRTLQPIFLSGHC